MGMRQQVRLGLADPVHGGALVKDGIAVLQDSASPVELPPWGNLGMWSSG